MLAVGWRLLKNPYNISAAGRGFFVGTVSYYFGFNCAGAGVAGSAEGIADYSCGAANSGHNGQRLGWAVQRAGAAFHAGVQVYNVYDFTVCGKNFVGADVDTYVAAHAFIFKKFQGIYIF